MPLDSGYKAHRACLAKDSFYDGRSYSKLERLLKEVQQENQRLRKKMEVEVDRIKKRREMSRMHKSNVENEKILQKKIEKQERPKMETNLQKIRESFVKQRAKDLTMHAQTVIAKEKEIKALKERCTKLKSSSKKNESVISFRPTLKDEEFQNLIAQQTKERMHLERHLSLATESLQRAAGVNVSRYLALEETNRALRQRLNDLNGSSNGQKLVEQEFLLKVEECKAAKEELEERTALCIDLEKRLKESLDNNTELVIENCDLQAERGRFLREKRDKEVYGKKTCKTKNTVIIENCDLQAERRRILRVRRECDELENILSGVESNIVERQAKPPKLANNLEAVVRSLREAGEKRKELEKEHAEAIARLRTRQEEEKKPRKPGEKDRFKSGDVESIESLESLVRELAKKCELQHNCHEELMLEMTSLRRQQAKQSWSSSQQSSFTDGMSPESNMSTPPEAISYKSMSNGDSGIIGSYNSGALSDSIMHSAPLSKDNYNNSTSGFGTVLESTSKEIDRIMARIEQDNKVLAELDRPRSALGFSMITDGPDITSTVYDNRYRPYDDNAGNTGAGYALKTSISMNELNSLHAMPDRNSEKRAQNNRTRSHAKYQYTGPGQNDLDKLMAKLAQDNRVLAELDRTRANIGTSILPPAQVPITQVPIAHVPISATYQLAGPSYRSTELLLDSNRNVPDPKSILKFGNLDGQHTIVDETVEYIEIPNKGLVQIFMAKYTYDPLSNSPNENPEAELSVVTGEHIIVYGDIDEDGFYNGELLDGRTGLVPSNFITKVTGEDLHLFQTQVLYGSTQSDDSVDILSQEFDSVEDCQLSYEDYKRMNEWINLDEDIDEDNLSELGSDYIPPPNPPLRLTVRKQLARSLLIAFIAPEDTTGIHRYEAFVNGELKGTIMHMENTAALLEGIEQALPHRISVVSIAHSGRRSKDASCTATIGKESPLAPAYVRAHNITSTAAIISWLPSNSNFQHVICVNSVEVRTVKPGIFRHTITGLAPISEYRVSVRSKAGKSSPSKSAFNDEKNKKKMERLTAYVDFKTLPKGLPDPPIDVQVEPGPQDNTLLVTWLPVTISATGGTSNGCPVTGYSVCVNGSRMEEVDSPTCDHTLLDISSMDTNHSKTITVRTKSGDNLSGDSISCKVSQSNKTKKYEEIEETSDRDELSDIAEEPEEELSDNLQTGKATDKKANRDSGEKEPTKKQEKAHKESSHQKTTKETGTSPVQRSSKEGKSQRPSKESHRHQESRGAQKSTSQSSGKKKHEVAERRDSSEQIILETEDNLSDKEIMPSSHVAIPSIEITKDSASEGRNSIEPFSDEDYEHAPHGRSRSAPSDKYANERQHKDREQQRSSSHGRPQQNPHAPSGQDRGYADKRERGSSQNPQQSRRSNHGYNSEYHNDYRHEDENYRRSQNYRKDRDYKRGDDYRRDNQSYRSRDVRQFVALYDYAPATMSPNPDAVDEELAFSEGQIITIYGDKDSDGFYRGEYNGRAGFVPCNMVSEVQIASEEATHHVSRPRTRSAGDYHGDHPNGPAVKKMVALFDYDPRKSSPNVDAEMMELAFFTGETMYVHGPVDADGFYLAELNGHKGLVPSNYIMDLPADYRDVSRHELVSAKVSQQRRKGPREVQASRGPPHSASATSEFFPPQQSTSGPSQPPQDHRNTPARTSYTNEKGPYPAERGSYASEKGSHSADRGAYDRADRSQYPSERAQYPNEKPQYNERGQYSNERGQYQNERGQFENEKGPYAGEHRKHPNERSQQYPTERPQHGGPSERMQYSAERSQQLPNDRSQLPNERPQFPGDRAQFPTERSQYPGERSQFSGDRPQFSGDRPQLQGERSQFQGERSQFQGDRSQFQGDRSQYQGDRSQFQGDRSQFQGDRSQFHGERSQFQGDRPQHQGDRSQYQGDRSHFTGERSHVAADRSQVAGDRSQLSGDRSQLPGDRSQLSGDRSQFHGERPQYASERGQYNDRGQYPSENGPANRGHYHGERSQYPPEQGQYQGERSAYSGAKNQYANERGASQGDRSQGTATDRYHQRPGTYQQIPPSNSHAPPTNAEQYPARNQNSTQFNNAPSRMPYGQSQKVGGGGGKW